MQWEAGHRPAILIADDDTALAGVIVAALSLEASEFRHVATREAAIDALNAQHWDLILLDTLNTRPSGDARRFLIEACRCAAGTPVLVMTAWQEIATFASDALPDAAVLEKPFDLDRFTRTVADLLKTPRDA